MRSRRAAESDEKWARRCLRRDEETSVKLFYQIDWHEKFAAGRQQRWNGNVDLEEAQGQPEHRIEKVRTIVELDHLRLWIDNNKGTTKAAEREISDASRGRKGERESSNKFGKTN